MKLDGDYLEAAYYCTAREIRHRQLRNERVPPVVQKLYDRLDTAIRMSHTGHESDCAAEQLVPDKWITARQAAELIGRSTKTVHRIRTDLDGERIDSRWLFKLSTVTEYIEGKDQHG